MTVEAKNVKMLNIEMKNLPEMVTVIRTIFRWPYLGRD